MPLKKEAPVENIKEGAYEAGSQKTPASATAVSACAKGKEGNKQKTATVRTQCFIIDKNRENPATEGRKP